MQAVAEGTRWMLRLDQGQDLFATLGEFAREHAIRAAVVSSGIGMLRDVAIGYWNGSEYVRKDLAEPHELVGLHGSIAEADGPSIHLHAALAAPNHQLVGGHLIRGTVWVLNELLLDTFPGRTFGRAIDETLGLRKLDLEPERLPPR
ncbi:MAG: DNA-binding protein [Thermoplasmata archaeon]|nr:DNA-binding protein [Thermoplasmata archaeon]